MQGGGLQCQPDNIRGMHLVMTRFYPEGHVQRNEVPGRPPPLILRASHNHQLQRPPLLALCSALFAIASHDQFHTHRPVPTVHSLRRYWRREWESPDSHRSAQAVPLQPNHSLLRTGPNPDNITPKYPNIRHRTRPAAVLVTSTCSFPWVSGGDDDRPDAGN